MFKDWLFYGKGERRAIIILLLALLLIFCVVAGGMWKGGRPEMKVEALSIADSLYAVVEKGGYNFRRQYSYGRRKGQTGNQHKADDGSGRYRPVSLSDKAESRKDTLKYPRQEKFASGIVIDVNTADTSVLKKIPGIGSVISRNVVDYRERLGGFHDIDQLLEVKYVDTALLKWFDVKTGVYRKISVNSAGIDELRKHPYMDFYKARAIVEYRRKRGKIKSLSQISMFKEFSDSDIDRLRHYLSFD